MILYWVYVQIMKLRYISLKTSVLMYFQILEEIKTDKKRSLYKYQLDTKNM